jgi:hypothetical protein
MSKQNENPANRPQPFPWRLSDSGLPEIVDAAGDLVTAVGNDFSSLAGDYANARAIVDAVNAIWNAMRSVHAD